MLEIRQVLFPLQVEEKLWTAHGLTQWDVEQVVYDPDSEARWDVDARHGGRVIVRGILVGPPRRLIFVSLALVDPEHGVWTCITAFSPTNPEYGTEGGGG